MCVPALRLEMFKAACVGKQAIRPNFETALESGFIAEPKLRIRKCLPAFEFGAIYDSEERTGGPCRSRH